MRLVFSSPAIPKFLGKYFGHGLLTLTAKTSVNDIMGHPVCRLVSLIVRFVADLVTEIIYL